MITTTTNKSECLESYDRNHKLLYTLTTYKNGSENFEILDENGGKIITYTNKNVMKAKIVYSDKKDLIYKTKILYPNETVVRDFHNGTKMIENNGK